MRESYRFGAKAKWRRKEWNYIKKHCPVHPSKARVLALLGPNDADLWEARARGFKLSNFTVVERDRSLAAQLRKRGLTVIGENLSAVLSSWDGPPFHVLLLDMTTNSHKEVVTVLGNAQWSNCSAMPRVVITLNMMCGRETDTAEERALRDILVVLGNRTPPKQVGHRAAAAVANAFPTLHRNDVSNQVHNSYISDNGVRMDSTFLVLETMVLFPEELERNRRASLRIGAARAIRTMKRRGQLR